MLIRRHHLIAPGKRRNQHQQGWAWQIDRVLKPYLFRPINFTELAEIQQIITQLYIDRGYFTTGAFIPPQKIKNRTLKIEIIEGTISEIKVKDRVKPGS